jgi:hypothetical protein
MSGAQACKGARLELCFFPSRIQHVVTPASRRSQPLLRDLRGRLLSWSHFRDARGSASGGREVDWPRRRGQKPHDPDPTSTSGAT